MQKRKELNRLGLRGKETEGQREEKCTSSKFVRENETQ